MARVSISNEDAREGGNVAVQRHLFLFLATFQSHLTHSEEG